MAFTDMAFPKHYVAGGVYVKELILEAVGDEVLGHEHEFPHLSLVARGTVRVTVDGVSTEYTAPTALTVAAGKRHSILAVTSNCLWYCLHAVPEGLRGEDLLDESVKVKRAQ